MPRTRSLAMAELKIGLLAVAALVLSAALIFLVGGQGGFPWQRYHLKTRFADVRGLKSGAVVRVAGVEVGQVASVEFVGAQVEIVLEISRDMRSRITGESRASIGSLSLLGEPVVDITPSTAGPPLDDWAYVPSSRSAGQLADVAEGATVGLQEATRLIQDLRRGRGTIGRLLTDDTLFSELRGLLDASGEVAARLNRGDGSLGALLKDPAAYQALQTALADLNAITRRIRAGEGSLGQLLSDDALARSLTSTTDNLNRMTARMNSGDGTIGKLMTESELYDRLNTMAQSLDRLTARLNQGEGTVGQLLQDRQLYENMNEAVAELRSLVSDIRKDPKKYLNVRVSIF